MRTVLTLLVGAAVAAIARGSAATDDDGAFDFPETPLDPPRGFDWTA